MKIGFLSEVRNTASSGGRVVRTGIVAGFAVACVLLIASGPPVRATLEAERAKALDADNQEFCRKFGVEPETSRYPECAAILNDVRTRHLQRSADFFF